ncbi:MAG: hypothetical protein WC222_01915 [Parachlamydiales bacterium]|jgi:hypothetical protein
MLFNPQLNTIIPLVGANFVAYGLILSTDLESNGLTEKNLKKIKEQIELIAEKIYYCANTVLAGCTALAVIGSGGAGYAAFGVFVAAGVFTLGNNYKGNNPLLKKWNHYAENYSPGIGKISTLINLGGGIYSIISLPFSFMNLGGTFFAACGLYI